MEIRILRNCDLKIVMKFLSEDYVYNADIISIIEKIGIEGKSFQIYGVFDSSSSDMMAIIFFNHREINLYIPFYDADFIRDEEVFFHVLKNMCKNFRIENVLVNFSLKSRVCDFLEVGKSKNQYLCVHNPNNMLKISTDLQESSNDVNVIELGEENSLRDLISLHSKCFGQGLNAWKYKSLMAKKMIRVYGIYVDGVLVSKGEWICISEKIGYISGLCTDENYRKSGFCSRLVKKMNSDILSLDRLPMLSYEEEFLRNFYDMLGFECMYIRSVLWLII